MVVNLLSVLVTVRMDGGVCGSGGKKQNVMNLLAVVMATGDHIIEI